MRKTSAPASNRLAMARRSEDAGPRVATILVRRRRRISCGFAPAVLARPVGLQPEESEASERAIAAVHGCLVGRFGELDGPGRLVAGIDFEKAGAIIAAREAIVRTADGELLFPRAHECLARPFSAAVVVDGIDVIEARDECAPQHGLAAAGGDVPP